MAIPVLTVNSEHPHVWAKQSDRAAYVARTNDTAGWKTLWDDTIIPRANTLKAQTNSFIMGGSSPEGRFAVLVIAGWIEETGRPAGGYKDVAIRALKYLAGLADTTAPTGVRERLEALAVGFDFLYTDMTTAERDLVAAEMVQQVDRASLREDEEMDGWSGNDQCSALAAILAGYGHPSIAAAMATRLQRTLGHFYGTQPNRGRLTMARYSGADGADEKGANYTHYGRNAELRVLWFLAQATNLDTFTQESAWASKVWEWFLWQGIGGSYAWDLDPLGDTAKPDEPIFHVYSRWDHAIVATKYPNTGGLQGGQIARWCFDQWTARDTPFADNSIFDVIFLDRAAVSPVHPKDASTPPATKRLFTPPGIFFIRRAKRGSGDPNWHRDNVARFRISARKKIYLGHAHVDAGSVRADVKGDPCLLSPAGYYDDFGGVHHANAYQRSWLQSLCPIVKDPGAVYTRYSQAVVNDGGQQFRKFSGFIPPSSESDPNYSYAMVNDAGGLAWARADKFDKLKDTAEQTFLRADIREAYRRRNTDPQRCPVLDVKFLIIEPSSANGLFWPAMLWYARIQKQVPSWMTEIPFHAPKPQTLTAYGWHNEGHFGVSKLWVDVRNLSDYTRVSVARGTPLDANGYGPDQFRISGAGTNYKPVEAPGDRHHADLKTDSIFLRKNANDGEERYVCLLMLSEAGDSEPVPSRAWVTDAAQPDYYGVTLGTETHLVHRTLDLAVFGGSPDTTPPAECTGKTLTPRHGGILTRWTDPTTSDFSLVRVYRRNTAT